MNLTNDGILVCSLTEDGDKRIAPSFSVREFRSKCGADHVLIAAELAGILQHLRQHFGKPITISSGYRSPAHNAKVGGSPTSQHMGGKAADIQIAGIAPQRVYDYMDKVIGWHGGLGLYPTFVHIDVRRERKRW
jgi:uncharacterized protein YcbK (DUF882 family)